MVPTVFFGHLSLLCLGPLSVIGDDLSWLPNTIPWPAQQCIDKDSKYVGECVILPAVEMKTPYYRNISPCRSLKCALPRSDGGHTLVRTGKPKEGTFCGILKACRKGLCIDIPAHTIPTATGVQTTYDCRPQYTMPKGTNNSSHSSHASSRKM